MTNGKAIGTPEATAPAEERATAGKKGFGGMRVATVFRRFLMPAWLVTLVCALKYRSFVSPRAEVELTPLLKLGRGTRISSFAKIKATGGPLVIGSRVAIGAGTFIGTDTGGITIGDETSVSPNVTIVANNYRFDRLDIPIHSQGTRSKGVSIGEGAWIGAGAVILDGAGIGAGAIIGANAVVSGTVPALAIALGNPAKVVRYRDGRPVEQVVD